jgi:hypothetical protein
MQLETSSKEKLSRLLAELQPVINRHLTQFERQEIEFVLNNYRKYLKIDLLRDFESAKERAPVQIDNTDNTFNDILSSYIKDNP